MKKVIIEKPATWVLHKSSLCATCWAGCCTLPVEVSAEELYHMGFLKAIEVEGRNIRIVHRRIAQRLMRQGILQAYREKKDTFILAQVNGNDCVFLDENRRCKIYENRPSICRKFPIGGARGENERKLYCPYQDKNRVGQDKSRVGLE